MSKTQTQPQTQRATRPEPGAREVRVRADHVTVETRADGKPGTITGHAAVFDVPAVLFSGKYFKWTEVIRPGAFTNAIAENQDVIANVDHDDCRMLGRTRSATCRLSQDATGLAVEIDPPDIQLGRDMAEYLGRKDYQGMSFAFRVRDGGERVTITSENGVEIEFRELLDLDLLDVSIVGRPAYTGTDVAIRARCEARDRPHRDPLNAAWDDDARARLRLAEADAA